jgi:ATPase subunit of ABC transporter with duplicated ATPase domains
VLALDNLSKSFGGRVIFDSVSWSMPDDGRVGLVGLNGAGKSTLLKMIAGVIAPDSGRIARPQRSAVGYLAQDAPEMGGRSVLDETLSALAEMQALDARRVELEKILAAEPSGAAHDAALEEFGEVLTELERHEFYNAESRATAVLFGLGFLGLHHVDAHLVHHGQHVLDLGPEDAALHPRPLVPPHRSAAEPVQEVGDGVPPRRPGVARRKIHEQVPAAGVPNEIPR